MNDKNNDACSHENIHQNIMPDPMIFEGYCNDCGAELGQDFYEKRKHLELKSKQTEIPAFKQETILGFASGGLQHTVKEQDGTFIHTWQ